MRLTYFICTDTRNHQETLREIFEKRKKPKPTKNQKNSKYQYTS